MGTLLRRRLVALLAAGGLAMVATALAGGLARASTGTTVVSLTFDDGQSSQYAAASYLHQYGLPGTFYVNSGYVGSSSYYMTWSQLHDLAGMGEEIGGHTVDHADLPTLSPTDATAEVCNDRTNIASQGFPTPVSFAYPYADSNTSVENIVKNCGYLSGRTVGNIYSPTDCADCPYSESIPPPDPYYLRTPDPADTSTTLSALEADVTNAENHGGGWVILVFHGVCDNQCAGTNSIGTSIFDSFVQWLAQRSGSGSSTVVRTIAQVMQGQNPSTGPTTTMTCNSGSCSGWFNAPVSVALTTNDTSATTSYRVGSGPWTSYTGPFTVSTTSTVSYHSQDGTTVEPTQSQQVQIDETAPSVTLTSPVNGQTIKCCASTTVAANASDTGGSGVARVSFYYDGNLIGTATASPYRVQWATRNVPVGDHAVYAVALDVAGNSRNSTTVTVHVTHGK